MIQRVIEEKVSIAACLKEKIFQKHFSDYKKNKINWMGVLGGIVGNINWSVKYLNVLCLSLECTRTFSSFDKKISMWFITSIIYDDTYY